MGERHVCQMDVPDVFDNAFRRGALDPKVVEKNPQKLHGLDREQERKQPDVRKRSFEENSRCGVIDCERRILASMRSLGPADRWLNGSNGESCIPLRSFEPYPRVDGGIRRNEYHPADHLRPGFRFALLRRRR